ncbi:MAG: hypothetical protein H7301_09790 [Cryobacterium sp.]|nr:hypothetical protein [Oligoflexia bacterium]
MRNTHRKTFLTLFWKEECGSVTIPFLVLSVILATSAISAIGYAVMWKSKMNLQLRLDSCAERTALELIKLQNLIEAANARMKIERATAAALAVPSGGSSLKVAQATLLAEKMIQDGFRNGWKIREASWILKRGCSGLNDSFLPLPKMKWWRPPDDPIGPLPLEWSGGKDLTVRIWHSNRAVQVLVNSSRKGLHEKWVGKYVPFF